ncbi:hypothetical protein D3C77_393040 [compost metagenome]
MIDDESVALVAESLNDLIGSLNRCKKEALHPGSLGRTAFYGPTGSVLEGEPAELFINAISDWDVMSDADNGSVPRYPALVEADSNLIDALEDFNVCKLAFKKAAADMAAENDKGRQRKLREILRREGMSRAHPLQCWREVAIFRGLAVKTVGFSTSKKSFSSKVLTRLQVISELEKRDAQDVIDQMSETTWSTVRWVNPVSPFVRANISFRGDDGSLTNAIAYASLPIIIEKGAWPAKLKFNQPKETTQDRKGLADGEHSIIPLPFRRDAYLVLS